MGLMMITVMRYNSRSRGGAGGRRRRSGRAPFAVDISLYRRISINLICVSIWARENEEDWVICWLVAWPPRLLCWLADDVGICCCCCVFIYTNLSKVDFPFIVHREQHGARERSFLKRSEIRSGGPKKTSKLIYGDKQASSTTTSAPASQQRHTMMYV